jgi:hypothetical protein
MVRQISQLGTCGGRARTRCSVATSDTQRPRTESAIVVEKMAAEGAANEARWSVRPGEKKGMSDADARAYSDRCYPPNAEDIAYEEECRRQMNKH